MKVSAHTVAVAAAGVFVAVKDAGTEVRVAVGKIAVLVEVASTVTTGVPVTTLVSTGVGVAVLAGRVAVTVDAGGEVAVPEVGTVGVAVTQGMVPYCSIRVC